MSEKLPINDFRWLEETQFNEDFIQSCNKDNNEGYFFSKLMFNTLIIYIAFTMIWLFYLKD